MKELIEAKRHWHYSPTLADLRVGFKGWRERGYLPHFDAPNTTQLVTFLLDDSFPVHRRREWEPILKEPDQSERRKKLEAWLDRGYGACWLRRPEIAQCVEKILLAQDGETYRLQAWVLMPNHVHVVVDIWQTPLCQLLQQWKGRSAHDANQLLARRGRFWQRESFDTYIRDADHLKRAVRYVESNPSKAALVMESRKWPWSSAHRRDEYNRLPWQRTGSERRL